MIQQSTVSTSSPFQSLSGLRPLLARELSGMRRPRWLITQLIVWTILLNGFLLLTIMVPKQIIEQQNITDADRAELTQIVNDPTIPLLTFLIITGMGLALYSALVLQDAIIQEKQAGTAAWILSKPVTRLAFILSKLAGHTIRVLFVIVLPQLLLAYVQLRLTSSYDGTLLQVLLGIPLIMLFTLCFSSLTLMLGTLFDGRAWVIGIPLFLVIAYQPISSFLATVGGAPFSLMMTGDATGMPLVIQVMTSSPDISWMPAVVTAGLTVSCLLIALFRFQRQEL